MITVLFWVVFGGLSGLVVALLDRDKNIRQTVAYVSFGIVGALFIGTIMQLFSGV